MSDKAVVILGGGITGLASAWYLKKAGFTNVTLVEAEGRLGGKIRTSREDGYLVEHGPDSFITTKPYALDLIDELGLSGELIAPKTGKFYILKGGALQSIPEGLRMMVPTNLRSFLDSKLFSWDAKHRILAESRIAPYFGAGDESFGSFIRRRFGTEMLENYAEPLFGGIYATPSDELSMDATFPQFRAMEHKYGNLTRSVKRAMQQPTQALGRSTFMSLRLGIQQLTEALEQVISGTRVIKGHKAIKLKKNGREQEYIIALDNGEKLQASELIITLPAQVTSGLVRHLNIYLPAVLSEFTTASNTIVTLAIKKKHIRHGLQATGFVSARNEELNMTAGTWSSEKWVGRAPQDVALLRCFLARLEHAGQMTDDEIAKIALSEMDKLIGIEGNAEKYWVHRWAHTLPQYKLGHKDKVKRLRQAGEALPGLHFSGAYLEGVGIPDCIKQAQQAVAEVVANTVNI